jgi:hypothetical protein
MKEETHQKVKATHLQRNAYLYIRQSTPRMVKILEPILTPTLRPTARMAQQAEVGIPR